MKISIGDVRKNSQTYCWQDSSSNSQQKPNDALRKLTEVNWENHGKRGSTLSHLVPQETSGSKCTMSVTAKAKQADEHDDEQEHVRNKRGSYCHFGDLDVKHHAGAFRNIRCIADLSEGLGQKV
jgi:hypothetical protein